MDDTLGNPGAATEPPRRCVTRPYVTNEVPMLNLGYPTS